MKPTYIFVPQTDFRRRNKIGIHASETELVRTYVKRTYVVLHVSLTRIKQVKLKII